MTWRINDNGIDRDMTDDEISQHLAAVALIEQDMAKLQAQLDAAKAAKASAREKLANLGLTDAEIQALVG